MATRDADTLTFTSIATTEVARQRLTDSGYGHSIDSSGNLLGVRITGLTLARTAGTGAITATLRIYDASSNGGARVDEDVTLAESGDDATNEVTGLDAYFPSGAWATVLADGGSGHGVSLVATYKLPTDH